MKRNIILASIVAGGLIVALIGAAFNLFPVEEMENIKESSDRESLEGANLSRNPREVIKGLLDPGDENMDALIGEELDNVRLLGVNTIYVYADHSYIDGKLKLTPSGPLREKNITEREKEDAYKERIKDIKENGFSVHLTTSFGGGQNKEFNVSLEQFLQDAQEADLRWAKIGEELQVETYAPSSEIDFQIFREYFGSDWNNQTAFDMAVDISNEYHKDILPLIKEVFTGKIIYQAGLWSPRLGGEGYDFFGTGVNSIGRDESDFRDLVRTIFEYAETNAQRQGSGWMVTELWIPIRENTGDPRTWPLAKTPSGTLYTEIQDELYNIVFEEYLDWNGNIEPSGLSYISYLNPLARTKDTPSEEIIREFFNQIN